MDVAATDSYPPQSTALCRHCSEPCETGSIASADGKFCCTGCEAVFNLLHQAGLSAFYTCDVNPGTSQKRDSAPDARRFAVLDDTGVADRLVTSPAPGLARVSLSVPSIHCSSCIWLLEQLWRFDGGIVRSEVDLFRRTVQIDFRRNETTLRRIAETLAAIGYEPSLSLEDAPAATPAGRRRLHLQIGIAGFAFGNIMLFSIPRYANGGPLDPTFERVFELLNVALATPVLFFSAAPYFQTAWHAVRRRSMAIEVPVAIGLAALYLRSIFDIGTGRGEGFFDSFAGLVFFLLIGRLLQHKVFDSIAFDRTYRSFLPLSVRVRRGMGLELTPLERLTRGDSIEVRPGEVVPADAELLSIHGLIDYAFVTGEQVPLAVHQGETVRAGGRVTTDVLHLRLTTDVSHSHLASLWNNPIFSKPKSRWLTVVGARFGTWFTVGAIGLAAAGAVAWWPDASASVNVATAVLIIACPCALTLSAPITLGVTMGLLAKRGLYLKHPAVALDLSRIDTIAFDKTGTLTAGHARQIVETAGLSRHSCRLAKALASRSTHPVSRAIASGFEQVGIDDSGPMQVVGLNEEPGAGISGWVNGVPVAIGTRAFATSRASRTRSGPDDRTFVRVGSENGWVRLSSVIRPGVEAAAQTLAGSHSIWLLSGDHDGERTRWLDVFGPRMRFRQTPHDKLAFIRAAKAAGSHVLMIGDGLNDSGALAAADVGITVSDDTACIVPACDAVVAGDRVAALPTFVRYARRAKSVVFLCFFVSVLYNAIGLTLALTGALTPLASAVLMPLSSLTIVGLSWGAMHWSATRMLPS
jgi:Cu+-exporting ATPase